MLKIPLYQTEWNSIDLLQIGREVGLEKNCLPDSKFYDAYYKKVISNPDLIAGGWEKSKRDRSEWLRKTIDEYGFKDGRVISIGAGTGLIEEPLIDQGYNIDLHDYQDSSFEYLKIYNKTRCFSGSWDNLESNAYDMCFTMATTYSFDDVTFDKFAKTCSRILKDDGICVIWDASLSWREIYIWLRNFRALPQNNILWGYRRTISTWERYFSDFSLLEEKYYKKGSGEYAPSLVLGIPLGQTPHRQVAIFKKTIK